MVDNKAALKTFLDKLVLPKDVEVHDLLGNAYLLPSSVSARRTIQVTRHLQNALGEEAVGRAAVGLDAFAQKNDIAAAVVHAIGLVASEEVVTHLARAFGTAHPEVVRQAWEASPSFVAGPALQDPAARQALPDDAAADLFALEELATGVLPLFVGLVRRSVQAFRVVTGAEAVN